MTYEPPVSTDLFVKVEEPVVVALNGEVRDCPRDLAQEVHHRPDVEEGDLQRFLSEGPPTRVPLMQPRPLLLPASGSRSVPGDPSGTRRAHGSNLIRPSVRRTLPPRAEPGRSLPRPPRPDDDSTPGRRSLRRTAAFVVLNLDDPRCQCAKSPGCRSAFGGQDSVAARFSGREEACSIAQPKTSPPPVWMSRADRAWPRRSDSNLA